MTPSSPSVPPPQPVPNGKPVPRARVEAKLTDEPLTQGYQATIPLGIYDTDFVPHLYLLRDIELMLTHPIVRNVLGYYKSGISHAEFWGGEAPDGNPDGKPISDDPKVADFVLEQVSHFWGSGVPKLQSGYEYGWIGGECCYENSEGILRWDSLRDFSPRDTFLLTQDAKPVGLRVKNIKKPQSPSQVDLWFASDSVPAKGLWYAHEPRYNSWYGQSQLFGAWRPWRRLAWRDGAETVIDTGVYRFAFCGPQVGYPEEDTQDVSPGAPATTLDSQGNPRRYARDTARQIAEQAKTGAGVGFPTTKYPPELGGGDKWTFKWPEHVLQVEPLIGYAKYLQDQISHGIGVPPELLEAGDIGSGYSGRVIPLEAFLARQQHIADAMLHLFAEQVLRPLVTWNFGPEAKFRIEVKDLLQTKRMQQAGEEKKGNGQALPPEEGQMPQGEEGGPPGQRDQGNPLADALAAGEGPQAKPGPGAGFSIDLRLVTDRVRQMARRVLARRAQ